MPQTSAPKEIVDLVERFERNLDAYRSDAYNETRLRREFIDPFFRALGWDVDNESGAAEAYKDVVHEDSIKIGGATKAPDYCFRIGGTRKFFIEAKKPGANLKQESDPAFQLRRYAWSSKLPLSILSNFREFVVYDCRIKPDKNDPAATARILYLPFTDYLSPSGSNWPGSSPRMPFTRAISTNTSRSPVASGGPRRLTMPFYKRLSPGGTYLHVTLRYATWTSVRGTLTSQSRS